MNGPTARTYRFSDSQRPGLLLGLSGRQAIPIATGVLAMATVLQTSLPPLVGVLGPAFGVVIAFGKWRGASVVGAVNAAALPRTADRLAPDTGGADVSWRIVGTTDASGRSALEIRLDGTVPLVCQRCLQAFAWPVAQSTLLLLARDARELALLDDDDEHEVLLADAPLEALTLVEDELLLTLPFVPRCERSECAGTKLSIAESAVAAVPKSAFAALAGLQADSAKKAKN